MESLKENDVSIFGDSESYQATVYLLPHLTWSAHVQLSEILGKKIL